MGFEQATRLRSVTGQSRRYVRDQIDRLSASGGFAGLWRHHRRRGFAIGNCLRAQPHQRRQPARATGTDQGPRSATGPIHRQQPRRDRRRSPPRIRPFWRPTSRASVAIAGGGTTGGRRIGRWRDLSSMRSTSISRPTSPAARRAGAITAGGLIVSAQDTSSITATVCRRRQVAGGFLLARLALRSRSAFSIGQKLHQGRP